MTLCPKYPSRSLRISDVSGGSPVRVRLEAFVMWSSSRHQQCGEGFLY